LRRWLTIFLAAALACVGCDSVLGLGQFTFDGSASDASDECVGPNGCWACTPTTNDQFLNACSGSCVTFDETRLNGLLTADGGLPPLPPISDAASDVTPNDASPVDAGNDTGGE
jgi:hypothetical protein